MASGRKIGNRLIMCYGEKYIYVGSSMTSKFIFLVHLVGIGLDYEHVQLTHSISHYLSSGIFKESAILNREGGEY